MVVVRQEEKIINWKTQMAVVTTHPSFVSDDGAVHLHCAKRWFKVTEEGPEDLFFGDEPVEEQEIGVGQQQSQTSLPPQMLLLPFKIMTLLQIPLHSQILLLKINNTLRNSNICH